MEDEKTYMVFFDEENQKFRVIVDELEPWPKDLGLYIMHTDDTLLIYLFIKYIERKIESGEFITRKWILDNNHTEALEWFRQNNIPIKQWDGTFK